MTNEHPVDRRPEKQLTRGATKHAKTPFTKPFSVAIHNRANRTYVGSQPSNADVEFNIVEELSPEAFMTKVRQEISARYMLSPAAKKLLEVLQRQAETGKAIIRLDLPECQRWLGERTPSKSTFYRGVSELMGKQIVAKSQIDSLFHFANIFGSRDATGQIVFSATQIVLAQSERAPVAKTSRRRP